ncbi:hypothetical protein ACVJ6Q_008327, partial [Bradyrhizobium elkanii]
RDNHRGDHHRAATLTRHPDRRALPTQIVALYRPMVRANMRCGEVCCLERKSTCK